MYGFWSTNKKSECVKDNKLKRSNNNSSMDPKAHFGIAFGSHPMITVTNTQSRCLCRMIKQYAQPQRIAFRKQVKLPKSNCLANEQPYSMVSVRPINIPYIIILDLAQHLTNQPTSQHAVNLYKKFVLPQEVCPEF